MDEFKKTEFDDQEEYRDSDQTVNEEFEPVEQSDTKNPFAHNRNWFADDFETTVRNSVPKNRALSIYRPKEKKMRKVFKNPVFTAVISSVLTCVVCFGLFAANYRPNGGYYAQGSVLPSAQQMATGQALGTATSTLQTDGKGGVALTVPQVYEKASPAVVSILVQQSQASTYLQNQEVMSSGSGIIVRADGYIVTNNHVIDGAASISVTTIGGDQFEAKVIGSDARTDLAVLKIENDEALPFAELGDSSLLHVGDMALAIGNPLREELAGTLTVGYISAINRTMVIDGKQMTMLQTDAAINPGNSGGALLNIYGQVIGINTAKSIGEDVEGLGFAIPINEAKPIIESIIKDGYVTGRPLIGLMGRSITEQISKAQDLPIGVYVSSVTEFGAAERAGIRAGDVLLECEGQKISTVDEINKIRDAHKPGDVLKFKVYRSGRKLDVSVKLQEEKPTQEQSTQSGKAEALDPFSYFRWFGW